MKKSSTSTLVFNADEIINEHIKLTNLLRNTINRLTVEYNKQMKELEQYKMQTSK